MNLFDKLLNVIIPVEQLTPEEVKAMDRIRYRQQLYRELKRQASWMSQAEMGDIINEKVEGSAEEDRRLIEAARKRNSGR